MSQNTPRLNLPLIQPAQAQKHMTHNSAIEALDLITQLTVVARDAETPPSAPVDGDCYALGLTPNSDWTGQPDMLAIRTSTGWLFVAPQDGWRLWDAGSSVLCVRTNGAWTPATADLQNTDGVGIGTTSDQNNRLAVSSPATLLTHDAGSGGHQLKVNKATNSDTASLLFQTGYSGRAEMGTTGSDDFTIKVSPDGAIFHEAVVVDKNTGIANFPAKPRFSAITNVAGWMNVSGPNTNLQFVTATTNVGGHFNPGTSAFTAPVAGFYCFLLNGFLSSQTNGRIAFGINGTTVDDQMQVLVGEMPLSFTAVFTLAAGDVVTCRTGNVSSFIRYYQGHTTFSGWLI
ncbi:DUF2793 domain-containing protein [Sulfitobacter guttiformis]|uniref:C1q domain-containing protein n=1 Tax=Sulfitobacter guttiformis TaxID=74349 RepID=J7G2Q8_9RHOB|nr:DUF2793 domain-containing protein [Sulfitobacter guttiformis]AFP55469.1 conserved hypothetical protein [Sulfitobacter guttiformis]KIN75519.1 DUF2793 multi-domain protein [Sulfitobacter guttiformis KCTC 32187]RKE92090.1 C1q domain-containing protein [Sulfitobacter guttiformis]